MPTRREYRRLMSRIKSEARHTLQHHDDHAADHSISREEEIERLYNALAMILVYTSEVLPPRGQQQEGE